MSSPARMKCIRVQTQKNLPTVFGSSQPVQVSREKDHSIHRLSRGSQDQRDCGDQEEQSAVSSFAHLDQPTVSITRTKVSVHLSWDTTSSHKKLLAAAAED